MKQILIWVAAAGIGHAASIAYTAASAGVDSNDGTTVVIGCMSQDFVYANGATAACAGSLTTINGGFAVGSASAMATYGALHGMGTLGTGGGSPITPYVHASAGGFASFVDYFTMWRPGANPGDPMQPFSGTVSVTEFLEGYFSGDSPYGDNRNAQLSVLLTAGGTTTGCALAAYPAGWSGSTCTASIYVGMGQQVRIEGDMTVEVNYVIPQVYASGASDFSNTGKIVSMVALDDTGVPVPDAFFATYSGTQYGLASAPEVGSVELVAGGLLLAMGMARRKRRIKSRTKLWNWL
jgi:hypothetical protein